MANQQQLDYMLDEQQRRERQSQQGDKARRTAIRSHRLRMIESMTRVDHGSLSRGQVRRVADFLKRLFKSDWHHRHARAAWDGTVTASQTWLADEFCVSRNTVGNWLRWAKQLGVAEWTVSADSHGVKRCTIVFNWRSLAAMVEMDPLPVESPRQISSPAASMAAASTLEEASPAASSHPGSQDGAWPTLEDASPPVAIEAAIGPPTGREQHGPAAGGNRPYGPSPLVSRDRPEGRVGSVDEVPTGDRQPVDELSTADCPPYPDHRPTTPDQCPTVDDQCPTVDKQCPTVGASIAQPLGNTTSRSPALQLPQGGGEGEGGDWSVVGDRFRDCGVRMWQRAVEHCQANGWTIAQALHAAATCQANRAKFNDPGWGLWHYVTRGSWPTHETMLDPGELTKLERDKRQQQEAARAAKAKAEQERREAEALEIEYGPWLDAMPRDEMDSLARDCLPDGQLDAYHQFGPRLLRHWLIAELHRRDTSDPPHDDHSPPSHTATTPTLPHAGTSGEGFP